MRFLYFRHTNITCQKLFVCFWLHPNSDKVREGEREKERENEREREGGDINKSTIALILSIKIKQKLDRCTLLEFTHLLTGYLGLHLFH